MVYETRASRAVWEWTKSAGKNQERCAEILSARCGRRIRQGTISFLARGMVQPKLDVVLALQAECGIEPDWWLSPIEESVTPVNPPARCADDPGADVQRVDGAA